MEDTVFRPLRKLVDRITGDTVKDCLAIPGWLSLPEAQKLSSTVASASSPAPVIVEIGSWLGQSSIISSKALKRNKRGAVYCIDPFELDMKSLPPDMMKTAGELRLRSGEDALKLFEKNIASAKVRDYITLIRGYSHDVVKSWDQKIDVLFIDGNHDYEAVKADLLGWEGFIAGGGWLLMHDVEIPSLGAKYYPGPGRVVEEYVLDSPSYSDKSLTDYLYVARKK